MKKTIMTVGLITLFMFSLSSGFAKRGETSQSGGGRSQTSETRNEKQKATQSSRDENGDGEQMEQTREQERENEQETEQESRRRETAREMNQNRVYMTEDGQQVQWQSTYTKKMMKYEDREQEDRMLKYLRKICRKNGITDPDETEEFCNWAFENKPWQE